MKDKLLFGTIGLLVGIVVMQWTMPSGQASIVVPAVGGVVAACDGDNFLMADGSIWTTVGVEGAGVEWVQIGTAPMPVEQIQFYPGPLNLVDNNGDLWGYNPERGWLNFGRPAVPPLAVEQSTWGKIKSTFSGKGDKP